MNTFISQSWLMSMLDKEHNPVHQESSSESTKIVGIVLVKDEDIFIENVLQNIIPFCDKIIVADNLSTDDTGPKIQNLASRHEKIEYHLVRDIRVSHDLISSYAGEKVWVFAVDGDEIYDPEGLTAFRKELTEGAYDKWWMIFGNVLNCISLDPNRCIATGHLAPPCRSMTKLYNFGLIESWEGSSGERLHGGEIVFKKGYDKSLRLALHEITEWENAKLRCLHMCFLQRSSKQKHSGGIYLPRPNPADIMSRNIFQRIGALIKRIFSLPEVGKTEWKVEKFTRGQIVEKDISAFFVNSGQE